MCVLADEVLINTPNNHAMALNIDTSYLYETYEELSNQEMIVYLREIASTLNPLS